MGSLKRKLDSLIKSFEKASRRGGLSYGMYDREIRKFLVSLLEDLTQNYEEDSSYFEIVGIIEDFFNQMKNSIEGGSWMIWTGIDFSRLRELLSGDKVEFQRLRKIWDYYKHLQG